MIIFLMLPILSAFAQEGYPKPFVSIEAIIKNPFCFPIVVTVNNKSYALESGTEQSLAESKWSEWNWLPGKMKGPNQKEVFHPLTSKASVDYGPNTQTHKNKFAYDFNSPEGTSVYAMEEGIVSRIIQNFDNPHTDPARDDANLIEVVHADGSVAKYYHLKKSSAKVKVCQIIKAQEPIAETGNTGFSSGPHLHVEIFRPLDGKKVETLPLKFK